MAPSLNNDGLKNSKMIVKRFWNKFKTPKEKIKKETEHDWVFDSTPDYFFEDKSAEGSGHQPEKPKNEETTSENEQCDNKADEEFTKDEDFSEKREEEKQEETRRNKGTKHRNTPTQITYNMNVNQGNVHIGESITQSYYFQQTYNTGVSKKGTKSKQHVKLSAQIEAVLQSTDKLESNHIEFLSKHFGKSCREIGIVLGISSGLIDQIEIDCEKDSKKMSFEILQLWMRNKGKKATVGRLCGKLWNSNILRAREAVKQLSDNIENFN